MCCNMVRYSLEDYIIVNKIYSLNSAHTKICLENVRNMKQEEQGSFGKTDIEQRFYLYYLTFSKARITRIHNFSTTKRNSGDIGSLSLFQRRNSYLWALWEGEEYKIEKMVPFPSFLTSFLPCLLPCFSSLISEPRSWYKSKAGFSGWPSQVLGDSYVFHAWLMWSFFMLLLDFPWKPNLSPCTQSACIE